MLHGCRLAAYGSLFAASALFASAVPGTALAQPAAEDDFVPVTDAMLQAPAPEDWLMWRRTLDGWGYSPLDQIDADNVADLRLVWSRALHPGSQQATPIAYGGVLYVPNPRDVIQAIDAASGDLLWEHRREVPDDIEEYVIGVLAEINRSLAIYDRHIIDTSVDEHVFASTRLPVISSGRRRSSTTGRTPRTRHRVRSSPTGRWSPGGAARRAAAPTRASSWPTTPRPARSCGAGAPSPPPASPATRRGAASRSRSGSTSGPGWSELRPGAGAGLHRDVGDLAGAEVLHRRGRPGAPVPQQHAGPRRQHRRDPLVLPASERPLGPGSPLRAAARRHGRGPRPGPRELDQPPAPPGRGAAGADRRPRQDGRRLHPRPGDRRVPVGHADRDPERHHQHRRGHGDVTENAEVVFGSVGQDVLACPHAVGGKDWEAGAYSPLTNTMYYPLRNVCARMMALDDDSLYQLAFRSQIAPGTDQVGTVQAISAETGEILWKHEQRAATTSLVATGGGLVFGGDVNGRFRALDQQTGEVLWEVNLGSPVTGFPITFAVDGRQYVAASTGSSISSTVHLAVTPELRPSSGNVLFVFALP